MIYLAWMFKSNKERDRNSTVTSIQSITCALQPKVNVSEVLDEWKLFQVDNDVPVYKVTDRIETFLNKVCHIHSDDGDAWYKVLLHVIKSALVLAQTNAESERSLSINARIVTQERASLGENTIVGLHVLKDTVNFYDPITHWPEKIPVTFWAMLNKFMMLASWSLSSFPYMNIPSCMTNTPGHCAAMSSILIWKMSWLILSPNGTCRNLYLLRCVLNVVRSEAASVKCIPKNALLPSTLENLVAPVSTCVIYE